MLPELGLSAYCEGLNKWPFFLYYNNTSNNFINRKFSGLIVSPAFVILQRKNAFFYQLYNRFRSMKRRLFSSFFFLKGSNIDGNKIFESQNL